MVIQTILVNPTYLDIGNGSKSTTLVLDFAPHIDIYSISGTATLLTNLAITTSSIKSAKLGQVFELRYGATITSNTFSFSLFGNTVPERLLDSKFVALCTYNGSTWDVLFLPDLKENSDTIGTGNIEDAAITTDKILDAAVTSGKIGSAAVTAAKVADGVLTNAKLANEAKEYLFPVPVHFDYSAKDSYHTIIVQDCTLVSVTAVASGVAIDGSNAATMTITNGGSTMLSGATLLPAGTSEGTSVTTALSSNNTVSGSSTITFTPDGSATTGKLFLVFLIRKD